MSMPLRDDDPEARYKIYSIKKLSLKLIFKK